MGETVAKKLARAFGSMERIENATFEELVAVDEIGEKLPKAFCASSPTSSAELLVARLKEAGLQMEVVEDESIACTDKLAGKSIVISGVFAQHSRNEYKAMIEQHGGTNVSSISGKTSFVLAGRDMDR